MPNPNFVNRTIWTGDNLDILRGLNSDSVDLIYLDPPFNSNQNYAAPIGSAAAGAAFKDTWTLSDLDVAWMGLIADEQPAVYKVVEVAGKTHSKGMQSYLCMMAVRLVEMQRVLKETGSIYLHCDDTAGHYLKLLMDAVFGQQNFKNEVVWRRATAHNDPRRFGRIVDYILYYSKGESPCWNGNAIATPKTPDEIADAYPSSDAYGRYRSDNLTGPLHSALPGSPSTIPWRGYDVYARGRCWSVPKTGRYAEYVERRFIPGYRRIRGIHDRLDALDKVGLIHHPQRGFWPGLKRYAEADRGISPQTLILTPTGRTNYTQKSGEWTGYPTQKPRALLERLIAASSNPGDMVLDPFCGCATACVAAERQGRQWIGIDLSPKATDLVRERLCGSEYGALFHWRWVTARTDIPQRTDIGKPIHYRKQKHELFGRQEGFCNGCHEDFPYGFSKWIT